MQEVNKAKLLNNIDAVRKSAFLALRPCLPRLRLTSMPALTLIQGNLFTGEGALPLVKFSISFLISWECATSSCWSKYTTPHIFVYLKGRKEHHFFLSAVDNTIQDFPLCLFINQVDPNRIRFWIEVVEGVKLETKKQRVEIADPLLHQ